MDHTKYIIEALKNREERTAAALILSNIERNPDRKAVVTEFGSFSRTYRAFLSEAAKLGAFLYRQGFRGRKIAFVGKNSYSYILALEAVFISNMTAIPIDPSLPAEKIMERIRFVDADLVLYDPEILKAEQIEKGYTFAECRKRALASRCVKALEDWAGDSVKASHEVLMVFSSGTGGKIKAVVLTQANLTVERSVMARRHDPEQFAVIHLPMFHIFGIADIDGNLFIGNTIYISAGFSEILKEIQYVKPYMISMVPIQAEFFGRLLSGREKEEGLKLAGGNLKSIRTSGAPLPENIVEVFRTFDISVVSDYGMTEVAGPVAVSDLDDGRFHSPKGSCGRVLDDIRVKIEMRKGLEYGEVRVSGYSVFSGYYNDEAATREVFVDGWFCTGDLGYIDKDGYLFIVGRKKNLIVLSSGENIIPEEVEAEIGAIRGVKECRVLEKNGQIAVEIFPENGTAEQEIRQRIREFNRKNPSYRTIASVNIESKPLPRTSTGKIKRA